MAARAHRIAAPVMPDEPAKTARAPAPYLCVAGGRTGIRRATSSAFGTNVSAGSLALTGTVFGLNAGYGIAGPPAVSIGGVSTAAQVGLDVGVVLQLFIAASGDVLSGADLTAIGWLSQLLTGRIASPDGSRGRWLASSRPGGGGRP